MNNLYKYIPIAFIYFSVGRPQDLLPFLKYLHLGDILGALTILSIFAGPKRTNDYSRLKAKEVKYLILLGVWYVICSPFSIHLGKSAEFLIGYVTLLIIFFGLTQFLNSKDDFVLLSRTFLLSATTISITSLISGVTGQRSSIGTMYDPNDLSMVLIVCLPFIFWIIYNDDKKMKSLAIITLIAVCIRIVSAQSRMGFLALLLFGFLFTFTSYSIRVSKSKKIIAVGLLFFLFMFLGTESYWQRMQGIFSTSQTGSGRTVVWKRALKMVSEKPFVGWGPGAFVSAYGRKLSAGEFELVGDSHYDQGWKTAHNSYILIMTESGIPALIIFLAMIGIQIKNLENIRKRYKRLGEISSSVPSIAGTIELSLFVYIFCAFFLSAISSPLFFILISANVLAKKIAHRELQTSQ